MDLFYASNAILAKARAMYGNRLTRKNYADLLQCRTVADVAAYLKMHTNYKDVLASLNENDIHRGQLEIVLRKKIFRDFEKLARYELSIGEDLVEYVISRIEIEQIMHSLMLLSAGKSDEYIYSMPLFFNKHTRIDLPALSKMQNYDNFLQALKTSAYYKILKPMRPPEGKAINLTLIEARLYTYLYGIIFRFIREHKDSATRQELYELFESYIDAHNFVKIMRLKKYYHSDQSFIRESLLPFGRLSKKQLDEMVSAESTDEVFDIMKTSWLGKKIAALEYTYLDELPLRIRFEKCRHNIRFSVNPPVTMISYIFLSEIELSNVINIIEGIRYQLPAKEIVKMLVCKKGMEVALQ